MMNPERGELGMNEARNRDLLLKTTHPLCFDVNVIYTNTAFRELFTALGENGFSSKRRVCVPSSVVAERVRQSLAEYGEDFDVNLIDRALASCGVEVIPFDRAGALTSFGEAVKDFASNDAWHSKKTSCETGKAEHGCGQSCRFADHLAYATARSINAILVTGDGQLADTVVKHNYEPGVIYLEQVGDVPRHMQFLKLLNL